MFLLLEDGIEHGPVKSKDSRKLGGALSRFGGTAAVLEDRDCLEKGHGKNNSLFCREAVHRDRWVAAVFNKNIQLGAYRVRKSWLRLESR